MTLPAKLQHALQPRLCPDCEAVAHTLAAVGKPNDRILKRCPHNGVIAVGSTRGGIIVNWHVEGPLTELEADIVGARILSLYAHAGLADNTPTRQ